MSTMATIHIWIGIIPLFNDTQDVRTLLDETPAKKDEYSAIVDKYKSLGVESGNTIFYYTNSDIQISPVQESYNDLKYIGVFDSILK